MSKASVDIVRDGHDTLPKSESKKLLPAALRRWLREPMLHFLLIGLALFAIYAYMHRGRMGIESSRQIVLSLDDLRQMDLYFESQWHRQPTPEEFQAMVEDKVREEVLYREGLAMGLDKDDTIVKRRMAQKMQFLAEDVAAAHRFLVLFSRPNSAECWNCQKLVVCTTNTNAAQPDEVVSLCGLLSRCRISHAEEVRDL